MIEIDHYNKFVILLYEMINILNEYWIYDNKLYISLQ